MANYLKTKHVVGLSSGSSAIYLALKALNVKKGDEVITTPFTWIITVNAILEVGAKPIFVDIDKKTYNIDPTKIESKISEKTKAILPVSLYGQTADFQAINKIASKYKIPIGFSGHEPGINVAIAAVSIGAKVVEKHVTLNKNMNGTDHLASIDMAELKKMVDGIREVEKAMGGFKKVNYKTYRENN